MKFLVDQPVSPLVAAWLRDGGHDAVHARDRGLSGGKDTEIIAVAIAESRLVVTADLDFPRLVALSGRDRPALILFRAGNISDDQMLGLIRRVMGEVSEDQLSASVVVIDEHSIRIASLPIGGGLDRST